MLMKRIGNWRAALFAVALGLAAFESASADAQDRAGGSGFILAADGRAKVVIAVPENPSPSVAYAAQELAAYLKQISGAEFSVRPGRAAGACIRVGEPCDCKASDEVRIFFKDRNTLVLTGEGTRGPLYAVYDLLERLGCGFWSPENETVPQRRNLTVPRDLNVVSAPCFEVRQPHGDSAYRDSKWKPKLRINGDMYVGRLGPELGGHRQYDIGQTAAGLPDPKQMSEHPDWFAWRKASKSRSMQQICMTNPEVKREVVRRAREMLKADPERWQVSVSVGDGGEFCECDGCMKIRTETGGMSGLELSLANFVARELAGEFPQARFLTFAYESTMRPPEKIKPEPNVDICFAYIQRNYARPPAETRGHNERLAAWTKLSGGNVYIWGYNAPFKDYMIPWPIIDTLGPEMRTYRDFGVKGVYMQMAEGTTADFIDLRCWLCAKLMWDPSQDEWKLMEEWCNGACGAGGPQVFAWLKKLKEMREKTKSLGLYGNDTRCFAAPEDLLVGDKLLNEALAATAGDERTSDQVRRIRFSLRHALLVRYHYDVAAKAKASGYGLAPRRELLRELQQDCLRFRNNCWMEGVAWFGGFLPRIRHGEVQPEKIGDGPRTRGQWTFRNPVVAESDEDPFVTYDAKTKSYYRLIAANGRIRVRQAPRAIALFDEGCKEVEVWSARGKDGASGGLRGAELVRSSDGNWRIYTSQEDDGFVLDGEHANDVARNKMIVLKSGKNLGKFSLEKELLPNLNAADPTVLTQPDGKRYLAFVTCDSPMTLQIRPLSGSAEPAKKPSVIFSTRDPREEPGSPTFVRAGDTLYLLYTVGGRSSADSRVMLMRHKGGDVCSAKNWERENRPVIRSGNAFGNDNTILAGPRAVSAFKSSDNTENWVIFRGWTQMKPIDEKKDSIVCMQRLDDGMDLSSVLLETGADLRILLLQPSGDHTYAK